MNMFISEENKHKLLKRSKWSTLFLALAIFQVVTALALLIPCLVHARRIYDLSELYLFDERNYYKAFKVSGECIMFILFEVWRLWLAIDGVVHLNSRTIYASALFTIFSFGFSITMIIESINWIKADGNTYSSSFETNHEEFVKLKLINQNLQIALGCIALAVIPPTFIIARNMTKDFGWDVYKKIGSSIKIQEMYITVEWLSLMLKIDFYFELVSYILLFSSWAGDQGNWTEAGGLLGTMLAIIILMLPSFILARISISMENHIMMTLFLIFQLLFLISTIYLMSIYMDRMRDWYAVTGYCIGVLLATIGTIILSIMCQLNFNKGLKEFVYWRPFSKKLPRRQSTIYNNMNQTNSFYGLGTRADMPIDDE